jgi:hypothetical protein
MKYDENFVEFLYYTGYGDDVVNVHRIGVDESGRATYEFDRPSNEKGEGSNEEVTFANLTLYDFDLISEKKEWPKAKIEEILKVLGDKCKSDIGVEALEKFLATHKVWPKSTIDGLLKVLSETCKAIGIRAPETLMAALAKATELVVTFEGKILEAGNENEIAVGSEKKDEND